MENAVTARGVKIACLASGFFLAWAGLAVASALPGCGWLRSLFAPACHQEPERCYQFWGQPVGLCVRCIWIYLGLGAGHAWFGAYRWRERRALLLLAVSVVLIGVDVALESLGFYHNWKAGRAVTGGLFGFACSWFTLRGLVEFSWSRPHRKECHESH